MSNSQQNILQRSSATSTNPRSVRYWNVQISALISTFVVDFFANSIVRIFLDLKQQIENKKNEYERIEIERVRNKRDNSLIKIFREVNRPTVTTAEIETLITIPPILSYKTRRIIDLVSYFRCCHAVLFHTTLSNS